MIVKFKKRNSRYPDLTVGQPYAVIGIEANDYRILNDIGRPFLYPSNLFTTINSNEPSDWVTDFGEDKERYSYPFALNKPGFFEDFFEEKPDAVATFWHLVNQRLPTAAKHDQSINIKQSPETRTASDWDMKIYAKAGLALGWAHLFEFEIVTVLLIYGEFSVRSEAEDFIRKSEKRPLTQLLRDVVTHVKFQPDITPTFEEAISARNFLVHHFFCERSWEGSEEAEPAEIIEDLSELTQLFFSAYKFAEMLRNLYFQQLDEKEIRQLLSEEVFSLKR